MNITLKTKIIIGALCVLALAALALAAYTRALIGVACGLAGAFAGAAGMGLYLNKARSPKITDLAMEPFDAKQALEGAARAFRATADGKSQSFTVDIDPEIPDALMGDGPRLAQAASILLENAGRFTPEGGSISLRATLVGNGDPCAVRVAVSDTGVGMTEAQKARLFKPAAQPGGGAARTSGEGLGMGLFLAHGIVEAMRGEIGVDSEPGNGSVFHFSVRFARAGERPRAYQTAPAPQTAGATAAAASSFLDAASSVPGRMARPDPGLDWGWREQEPEGRRLEQDPEGRRLAPNGPTAARALVAEDGDINREIVKAMLEPLGMQIVCAQDGGEAVRLFEADPARFDIVLMDVQMPGVDGLEATRHIRSFERRRRRVARHGRGVPIVAMTADASREGREKCLAAGMDGCLSKPLELGELTKALRQLTARDTTAEPTAAPRAPGRRLATHNGKAEPLKL